MGWPKGYTKGVRIEAQITYRCNARCQANLRYNDDSVKATNCNKGVGAVSWTHKDDMTVEQMRRAIDQLIEQRIWVRRFTFCGGESIMHKDLQAMIDEAARLPLLRWGRVLSNGLPHTAEARAKIRMPNQHWSWVVSPLDDPSDPLSGKNDWRKRDTRRYHQPFWISPADAGMEATFEKCEVRGYCGIGLDSSGFTMCGKAVMLGRLLGVDPTMPDRDGDIYEHVNTPIPEICRHCQYGLGGSAGLGGSRRKKGQSHKIEERWRSGELPAVSETFQRAFAAQGGGTVQIEPMTEAVR